MAGEGICDFERILNQIIEAIPLTEKNRKELLEKELQIARNRGCPRIINSFEISKDTLPLLPANPN